MEPRRTNGQRDHAEAPASAPEPSGSGREQKTEPIAALESQLAAPTAQPSVDEVVRRLCQLTRSATLDLALEVGAIVLRDVFGSDMVRLRSRGARDHSYRKLARHPNLPFSATTLWRSVAIYDVQRLPGLRRAEHLGITHLRAVLGLPQAVQERILVAAEKQRWTKEYVEKRASAHREKGGSRQPGRRRMAPAVKAARRIDDLLAGAPPTLEGTLNEKQIRELSETLNRVRGWCDELTRALDARNPPINTGEEVFPRGNSRASGGAKDARTRRAIIERPRSQRAVRTR